MAGSSFVHLPDRRWSHSRGAWMEPCACAWPCGGRAKVSRRVTSKRGGGKKRGGCPENGGAGGQLAAKRAARVTNQEITPGEERRSGRAAAQLEKERANEVRVIDVVRAHSRSFRVVSDHARWVVGSARELSQNDPNVALPGTRCSGCAVKSAPPRRLKILGKLTRKQLSRSSHPHEQRRKEKI